VPQCMHALIHPCHACHYALPLTLRPCQLVTALDDYVIGQTHAKKVLAVSVYNHYKRVSANLKEPSSKVSPCLPSPWHVPILIAGCRMSTMCCLRRATS